MGFVLCPFADLSSLTSVARSVCPFPDYSPSPLFLNMLSVNSSLHLRSHYQTVQSSLNPQQLEQFTQSLRTTFGREGKVTYGGVGVVALSLAVLFDTLARQVRGERVPESEPIPGLFLKSPRGYYPPQVYTVSEYLRLVPYIANNPTRMKEETKRYFQKIQTDDQSLGTVTENTSTKEDITAFNLLLSYFIEASLQIHHFRIKNTTEDELITPHRKSPSEIIFTFNCDPEVAWNDFLAEVQKSDNHTKDVLTKLQLYRPMISLQNVAMADFFNEMIKLACPFGDVESIKAQREDFDLKVDALRKWRD